MSKRGRGSKDSSFGYKKQNMSKTFPFIGPQSKATAGYSRTAGYYGRFGQGSNQSGTVEYKFFDQDIDDALVAGAGTVTALLAIAQGVTESTHVGRKLVVKHVGWKGTAVLPENSGASAWESDTLRLMLIIDKQCNGALPAVTDVLESADFQSFNNLANKGRFRVLCDKVIDLSHTAAVSHTASTGLGFETRVSFDVYKKLNLPVEYNSTTGAVTEIRSNNLILLVISERGLVKLDGKMRIRFSD